MIRILFLWFALLLAFFPVRPALAAPAATPAEVTAVRMGASPEKLRIVVDTDREVDYSTMVLSDPGRVVVDLHGARLGPEIARDTALESRFASRVRVGQFNETTVRIVVETTLGKGKFDVISIEGGPVPYRIVMDFGQIGTSRKDHGDGAEQPGRAAKPETESPDETTKPESEKPGETIKPESEKPDETAKPDAEKTDETEKAESSETGETAKSDTEKPDEAAKPESSETGEAVKPETGEGTEPQTGEETNVQPSEGEPGPRPVGPTAPTPSERGKGGSRDVTGAAHKEGDSGRPGVPAETENDTQPPAETQPPEETPEKEQPGDEAQKKDDEGKSNPETQKKDEAGKSKPETQKKDESGKDKTEAGKKPEEDDREELSEDVEFSPGIKGKVIVIDPGHGGEDSGAIGPSGVMEKTVTLRISKEVESLLKEAGAKVIMTRMTDTEVSPKHRQATDVDELQARCDVANKAKADIFVSIHMDSFTSREATGTTGYYYLKGSVASRRLAAAIQSNLVRQLRTVSRGVKTCRFYVVRHTRMPATLIEVAFLSNPKEEKLLTSEKGVKRAAAGIVQGISDFFGK